MPYVGRLSWVRAVERMITHSLLTGRSPSTMGEEVSARRLRALCMEYMPIMDSECPFTEVEIGDSSRVKEGRLGAGAVDL